jgi:curved DNA-binding protein CbpA
MDADELFKMIGEAYAVLSDPIKVWHAYYHYAVYLSFLG